ncbi:uncharacterized protein BDV17DRAFT_235365 [Aspergillus undulatus]|uniref:uncharacterized protein n=1 Tax=Aspergillus undulatus TaxID=1810928 RepID=UPI003CCD0237
MLADPGSCSRVPLLRLINRRNTVRTAFNLWTFGIVTGRLGCKFQALLAEGTCLAPCTLQWQGAWMSTKGIHTRPCPRPDGKDVELTESSGLYARLLSFHGVKKRYCWIQGRSLLPYEEGPVATRKELCRERKSGRNYDGLGKGRGKPAMD